jgi:acylphosphatase
MTIKACRLVIRGRVQGVGYRDAAVQAAFVSEVAGWVRNCADGTVEVFVQGTPEAVARYIDWCRRGTPLARVSGVDVADAAPEAELRQFDWRPTA